MKNVTFVSAMITGTKEEVEMLLELCKFTDNKLGDIPAQIESALENTESHVKSQLQY